MEDSVWVIRKELAVVEVGKDGFHEDMEGEWIIFMHNRIQDVAKCEHVFRIMPRKDNDDESLAIERM